MSRRKNIEIPIVKEPVLLYQDAIAISSPTNTGTGKEASTAVVDRYKDVDTKTLDEQKAYRYGKETNQRGWLIVWIMCATSVWLITVLAVVFLLGLGKMDLNITIVTTLLVTTTANVLGLAYIMLQGMFHQDNNAQ